MGIAGEYIQGVSIVVNYQRDQNFDEEVTEKEEAKSYFPDDSILISI